MPHIGIQGASQKTRRNTLLTLAITFAIGGVCVPSASATNVSWSDLAATTDWGTGTNWVGGNAPINGLITDTAVFNQPSYLSQPDAGTTQIRGITVGDGVTVTAPLTISGTSLGIGSGGITVLANAGATTISSPIVIATGQTWNAATGTTLAINGTVTRDAGSVLNVTGGGTVTTSQLNDATGIIGPWATFTPTGAVAQYATNTTNLAGGAIGGYTGATQLTLAGHENLVTSATTNYDNVNLALVFTGDRTANTLRFVGATNARTMTLGGAAATAFNLTLNGLMNSGNVSTVRGLTISNGTGNTGGVVIGASGELVFNGANGTITLNVPVRENLAGSSVVIAGTQMVTFNSTVASTFSGSITVNSGALWSTNQTNSLGSNAANVLYLSGTFQTSNNFVAGLNDGPSGGGIVMTGSASAKALRVAGGGVHNFSGTITNGVGVNALVSLVRTGAPTGTQVLSGTNTYSGFTGVDSGTLILDFTGPLAPSTNIVNNGLASPGRLNLGGGTLQLAGSATGANSQVFGTGSGLGSPFPSIEVFAGASSVQLLPHATTPQDLRLTSTTLGRSVGATVDFTLPGGTQTGTNGIITSRDNDATGITGPFATVASAVANSSDWATNSAGTGPGNIVAYTGYTTFTDTGTTNTSNYLLTDSASATEEQTTNSLKITTTTGGNALTIAAGKTLRLTSGGLLFTGSNDYTIAGADAASTLVGGDGLLEPVLTELIVQQFSTTNNLTISAVIAGVNLTKSGPGKLILTGNNTFTGTVYLNDGTVNINALTALGTGTAVIINGGTLQYDASFAGSADISTRTVTIGAGGATIDIGAMDVTYASAIGANGLGGLTKVGSGTLTLQSNNAYSGATTIIGGGLSVASLADGRIASAIGTSGHAPTNLVLDGAILRYTGGVQSTNRLFTVTENGATIDASGASNAALTFSNVSPLVFSGSGARTLTLTGASLGANTMTPVIGDAAAGATALAKTGAGTWLLTNANTYTGGTTVASGTLLANNTTGSATGTGNVTLNGGTLGGTGTVAGAVAPGAGVHTIAPSATLASNAASTLTVGSLTTNANTTFALNLVTPNTANGSDRIKVNTLGGLNLSGGTVVIANTSTGAGSLGYYRIFEYSGSIAGTGISSLVLPATVNKVVYILDTAHDPGFIDIHRGFEGDANDDGTVTFSDFVSLANNFGAANAGWGGGDFNGDGTTSFTDFVTLANNFGQTIGGSDLSVTADEIAMFHAASESFFAGNSIPEPTSLALLGLGAAGLLTRRHRRN